MSAAGIEPATNGLKGQIRVCASPIQEPIAFVTVHWTDVEVSLLDAVFKVCQHLCVQWTCLPADALFLCVNLLIFYYGSGDRYTFCHL
jgi:hypothetical protein